MEPVSFTAIYQAILTEVRYRICADKQYESIASQPWQFFSRNNGQLPGYGFKAHVSLSYSMLERHYVTLLEIIRAMKLSFKMPLCFADLVNLNAGFYGDSQVGKLFTIYTVDPATTQQFVAQVKMRISDPCAPKVPSDFYYDPGDCVSIRFGELGVLKEELDLCGRSHFLYRAEGQSWEDRRDGSLPPWVFLPKLNGITPKALVSSEEPTAEALGFSFKIKRTYGRAQKRVFLIEAEDGTHFILKQSYKYAGECEAGQNYEAMLRNEYQTLCAVQGEGIAPTAIRFFTTDQFAYLLTTDLAGDSCDKLPPHVVQQHLAKLLQKIDQLHHLGYIHRDIKLSNVVFLPKEEDFRLIDFELACKIGQGLPCSGGTMHYRHPLATFGAVAQPEFDWHSIRSMMVHAALGICPAGLPLKHRDYPFLLSLNGMNKLAEAIAFSADKKDFRLHNAAITFLRNAATYPPVDRAAVVNLLGGTAEALAPYLVEQKDRGCAWRNTHLESRVLHQGINIGAAGILLGLLDLHRATANDAIRDLIDKTSRYLNSCPVYDNAHGFMTGNAGVAVALAACGRQFASYDYSKAITERLNAALRRCDEPDLFFGMAGILYAHLQVYRLTSDQGYLTQALPLAELLQERVCNFEGTLGWPTTGTLGGEIFPTLGVSHGSAGIAMALYEYGALVSDDNLVQLAVLVIESLMTSGRAHQGKFLRLDVHPQSAAKGNAHWCHGGAGLLWALLNSGMWQHEELTKTTHWAASTFLQQSVVGNPSMCHGLGGQLETACMLARVPAYQEEARSYADRVAACLWGMRHEQTGMWPSEDPRKFTPDLWVGHLGPATAMNLWLSGGCDSILHAHRFLSEEPIFP